MVVYRPTLMVLGLSLAFASAGCGSGGRSSTGETIPASPPTTTAAATSPGTTTSGAAALQAEAASAAAGDIPDNQIFLTFHNPRAGYSMKYPEGWAQQGSGGSVTFRDKNNVIRAVVSTGPAWTRASVQADVRALKGAQVQSAAAGDHALRPARVQGRLPNGERPEPGHGQARDARRSTATTSGSRAGAPCSISAPRWASTTSMPTG